MWFKFFSIITLLFSGVARADSNDCHDYRLDRGGPMTFVKPENQPLRQCGPYVIAELMDAWRFSHDGKSSAVKTPGESHPNSSGFEIAVAYSAFNQSSMYADTSLLDIDRFLRTRHPYSCDENALPKGEELSKNLLTYWRKYSGFLNDKANLQRLLDDADQKHKPLDPLSLMVYGSTQAAAQLKCDLFSDQNLSVNGLAALIRQTRPMDYLAGIFAEICRDHHLTIPPRLNENRLDNEDWMNTAAKLEKIMTSPDAQPVALDFCNNVLKDPSYRGEWEGSAKSDCALHFAIALGQRFDPETQTCQLLVQDTSGNDCTAKYSSRWKCDHDQYWIDRDALLQNTFFEEHYPVSVDRE